MSAIRAAMLVVVALATGCARLEVLAEQQAVYSASVRVSVADDRVLHAVRHALTRLGWRVAPPGQRPWRVVAMRNESGETRDVAIVDVGSRGDLEVRVRTELANGAGGWITPAGVCDHYSFARERQIVARIETTVRRLEGRAALRNRRRNHE